MNAGKEYFNAVKEGAIGHEYGVPAGGATCFECYFMHGNDVPAMWTVYTENSDALHLCDKHVREVLR